MRPRKPPNQASPSSSHCHFNIDMYIECMIPLVLGCKQVVLVGDHQVHPLHSLCTQFSNCFGLATRACYHEQESCSRWTYPVPFWAPCCPRQPTHPPSGAIPHAPLLVWVSLKHVLWRNPSEWCHRPGTLEKKCRFSLACARHSYVLLPESRARRDFEQWYFVPQQVGNKHGIVWPISHNSDIF